MTITGGTTGAAGVVAAGGTTKTPVAGSGHYQMENLDRGVVAVVVTGGVYVGWRMMGYEYDTTATNVSYNLYRDGAKIANVTDSTNYLDAAGKASSSYSVTALIKGVEGRAVSRGHALGAELPIHSAHASHWWRHLLRQRWCAWGSGW
jgi:hypothetical protein